MADISGADISGAAFDPQGLGRLRQAAREDSPDALREAARQFEALFIHTMLKNMRETGFGDGLFDNDQTKMYQGMFDQQIAGNMAANGGIGLAEVLVRQLGGDRPAVTDADQGAQAAQGTRAYAAAARMTNED